jgi:glycosyltransferase involved in cell wall biosynthesis
LQDQWTASGAPVPVTFVGSHARLGGSEQALERLLATLGPEWVDRVILLEDGPAVRRLAALGARVEVLPSGTRAGLVTAAWRLRRRLAGRDARLVHANGVKAALVAALGLAGTGVPVLWVKHDLSWDGPLARWVAAGCAEVVGVSVAVLATLRRGRPRGLRRPRLTVVPNGVPEPEPRDAGARTSLLRELGVDGSAELVALVGRLHPAKGQLELVEAAPELLRRRPGALILLVGGEDASQPAYAARLRERIAALGLRDRVLECGHRDDAAALIGAVDVLAVPSGPDERGMGREGFGLAGVEALAAGTPVAGYADGALPEVLGDAAVLVAPGDRAALAEAVAALLADPQRRAALAEAGRRRFAERYRLEATAAAMAGRYRSAVSAPARRAAAG